MTSWSMRMDHYVKFGDNNIHLAAILYALITIGIGVLLLVYVLQRALGQDFKQLELITRSKQDKRSERRNRDLSEDEIGLTSSKVRKPDDVAWKKLQGDVFRKPDFAVLLCALIGMGIQVFIFVFILLIFLTTGFIVPQVRLYGAIQTFTYMVMGGGANGYVTGRTMRFFGATEWRFAASVAAFCLPCYIALTFILVDFIEYFEKSDQLFPFTSICFFSLFWILCNVPAAYFGAYSGFANSDDKPTCKVSAVRRPIPN